MKDDYYQMRGTISIPKEKQEEFNRKVLAVLDRGGIRKTETVNVAGQDFTVVAPVKADEQGILTFDYSIFEKKLRKESELNLNTGALNTSDRGYDEFGAIMNAIMVLQMIYSSEPCVVMRGEKVMNIGPYIALLNTMLDEKTLFNYGEEDWDTYSLPLREVFMRDSEDEFLEWWDGENLNLSEEMEWLLEDAKLLFGRTHGIEDFDGEQLLRNVLNGMKERRRCRLVDKRFVEEFLEWKDDPDHKKLLVVFWHLQREGVAMFPELTEDQALDWILPKIRDREDDIRMAGFATLLTNHAQRKRIFGI